MTIRPKQRRHQISLFRVILKEKIWMVQKQKAFPTDFPSNHPVRLIQAARPVPPAKSQKSLSKRKELSCPRRSKRLEDRSITKERTREGRSKSKMRRYAKYPTESHGIKMRPSEGLKTCMDRFKSESSHIKGVPPVLCISAFMHGHGHPELTKKLNDKIPKTVDEMFERVRAFIRGEVAAAEEANRISRSLRKVGSSSKRYPSEQSQKWKPVKERCESDKHDKWWKKSQETIRNRKIRFNRGTHLFSNSSELLDRRTNHIGRNDRGPPGQKDSRRQRQFVKDHV
ncbi:hypothetical protein Tco_1367677 [Tanacetum coccineum]